MDVRGQISLVPQRSLDTDLTNPPAADVAIAVQHSTVPPQRQKRIACIDCRQAKLKCEGRDQNSGTCVRCRRLSLRCEVDAGYQRVNKRLRLNDLVEEVEQLRSVVRQHDPEYTGSSHEPSISDPAVSNSSRPAHISPTSVSLDTSPSSHGQSPPQVAYDGGSGYSPYDRARPENSFAPPLVPSGTGVVQDEYSHTTVLAREGRTLEHITLTKEEISTLFQSFFEHYHTFLEILNPSLSPDTYYANSPVLFWAIISVSARRARDDATLFTALNPCVTKLIWSVIPVLPHSRYTVQAMLLLSVWQFPTSSMWTDTSNMLLCLAKTTSMQLGLHRPEALQDFSRVRTQLNRAEFVDCVKTWAGCFISAQSIPAAIGHPSILTRDWAIDQACMLGNKYTLPDNLRFHLLIHRFIARVNRFMAKHDSSSTGSPPESEVVVLMSMLEQDFVDLERQISHKLTSIHRILLCMASLQLRIYYFNMTSNTDIRQQGLLKAYSTAINLVSIASEADRTWDFITYAPDGYHQMIIFAAVLLMKVINSSYSRYLNVEAGKSAFNSLLALIRRASLEDNDLRGRAGKIMAQLWNVHYSAKERREQEPTLNIKTRQGASVFHDSLWIWREEFGGQRPGNPAPAQSLPEGRHPVDARNNIAEYQPPQSSHCQQDGDHNHESLNDLGSNVDRSLATVQPNNNQLISEMDIRDADWVWDVGFPSMLDIDPNLLPGSFQQF